MAHQGAILAQRPAERELGYLHVNHRSPKTATLGCSWRWSSGTHSSFPFFFILFFSFVILYHTCTTGDLPEIYSHSLGALRGSCRPVFASLGQCGFFQPATPASVHASATELSPGSQRTWAGLDRMGCAQSPPFSRCFPLSFSIKVAPQLPSAIKMSRCHLGC